MCVIFSREKHPPTNRKIGILGSTGQWDRCLIPVEREDRLSVDIDGLKRLRLTLAQNEQDTGTIRDEDMKTWIKPA